MGAVADDCPMMFDNVQSGDLDGMFVRCDTLMMGFVVLW
jgi:hypothetical protein